MEPEQNYAFIDWLTASQLHPQGGLPLITGGLIVHYDASGLPRFERNCSTSLSGSYETSLRIGCDGYRVSLSGNVGRFSREDNLFNHGWEGTKEICNRILSNLGLPTFTSSEGNPDTENYKAGAVVSRMDVTTNYATGSEYLARGIIRWLSTRSVARVKRGNAGDESVWWANTRHMFKAYIKALEMLNHGMDKDSQAVRYAIEKGVLRIEIELKKRLLSELKMNQWGDITQERINQVFSDHTEILRRVDRNEVEDIINSIPQKSRIYASAWLAGQDIRAMCSRASMFRHAKVLRAYGIDIMSPRDVTAICPKMRQAEIVPLTVPDWYSLKVA